MLKSPVITISRQDLLKCDIIGFNSSINVLIFSLPLLSNGGLYMFPSIISLSNSKSLTRMNWPVCGLLWSFNMCIIWTTLFYGIANYLLITLTIFQQMLNTTKPHNRNRLNWFEMADTGSIFVCYFEPTLYQMDNIPCWYWNDVCNLFNYSYITMTYN